MKKYYRDKLPKFIDHDLSNNGLILTDDLDSLLSCTVLQTIKNCSIKSFFALKYNKERYVDGLDDMLCSAQGLTDNADIDKLIGVDMSLLNGRTFDNHIVKLSKDSFTNPESVNINSIKNINRDSYIYKYSGSTLLQIWSIYDLPKTGLSDELMMLLLSIDSTYFGFYKNDFFRKQLEFYMLDVLELEEFWNCMQRHKYNDFKAVAKKYNAASKINALHGYLSTKIDIDGINGLLADNNIDVKIALPQDKFNHYATYASYSHQLQNDDVVKIVEDFEKVTFALTKKDFCNYCIKLKDGDLV